MWQLINLNNGEQLTEPSDLPENWGPIFGLPTLAKDEPEKLANLSWLGDQYKDLGWLEVPDVPKEEPYKPTVKELIDAQVRELLKQSDWRLLPDVPQTVGQRKQWIDYRYRLRNIHLEPGYPDDVVIPNPPQ